MIIDARGKACPTPVIMTKKALEEIQEGTFTVIVDNEVSKNNVIKFLESQGLTYEVETKNGAFYIDSAKGYSCSIKNESGLEVQSVDKKGNKIVVYISSETIGYEEQTLGRILMKGFFSSVKALDIKPKTIIFVNTGVFLTTKNEEVISILKELEENFGVEILNCGTCTDYFNITKEVKVGSIADAYTVFKKVFEADKVVRL